MAGQKNIIIWLEGRPETVVDEIFWLKDKGYQVKVISTAYQLASLLSGYAENVAMIITGRVLYAISDLACIGIFDASTDLGFNAGFVIIDRFLRANNSPYARIPVMIVATTWRHSASEKTSHLAMLEEFRNRKGHGPIIGMEKGGSGSREKFKKIFKDMVGFWEKISV